ncbi:MAG: LysR family transcriptional regulator, partial [Acidimicrobiales bacterium]|nr:LysR family transcriptional regulator [Acidimicrobiales bacterium]
VRSGASDLGFIETPLAVADLGQRVVANDQLVTVVAPDHPWATRATIPVEALAATPLVTREPGSGTREALEAVLRERRLGAPTSVLELGSTSAVRAAVLRGNAPTVISRLAVAAELDAGTLVEIDVGDLVIQRDLRAVWSPRTQLPPLATDLLASL